MTDDSKEMRTMRCMAWERAKGELRSMLHTYCSHDANGREINRYVISYYAQFSLAVEKFVSQVEDNGWQE